MRFAPLLAVFLLVPFVGWAPSEGFTLRRPAVVSGDEPHYYLIVTSILRDRDLLLGDDYLRVRRGGDEAGAGFRGNELDHHTILIDRRSGGHQLWQRVFDWRSHRKEGGFERLQPGFEKDAIEVPAHPPAFPALVALLLAPLRPSDPEPFAIVAVALICFGTLVTMERAAVRAGFTAREALAAVLLTGVASSLLPYARSFFSEPAIGLALIGALWALVAGKPALCGALCFAAAAVKPPFGLVALGWSALRFREGRRADAQRLLFTFAAGWPAIVVFNLLLAHTPLISGTSGFEPAKGLGELGDLFFGDAHGVFTFVPWAAAGFFVAARAAVRGERGLLRDLAWGAAPVLLVLAAADVEAGGFCYGPRYFVPFLPWLALATVVAWRSSTRGWRVAVAALVVAGALIAIAGAVRYRDLFDRPVVAAFRR
ncbi:MAG: hypothetical protein ABR567_11565 [Myxococcales bacterium]|nr:hypothetical protein [Myxococcales bacterium]